MADLDRFVESMKLAAKAAGLTCDPEQTQLLFVVEKELEKPPLHGHPRCSLGVSLTSAMDVPDGGEDAYATELIAHIVNQFPK